MLNRNHYLVLALSSLVYHMGQILGKKILRSTVYGLMWGPECHKFPALFYQPFGGLKKIIIPSSIGCAHQIPLVNHNLALWIPYAVVSQILLDWRRLSARISARTRSVQTSTYDTYDVRGWMKDMEATGCSIGMVEW